MEQIFVKMLERVVHDLDLLERKGYAGYKVLSNGREFGKLELAKAKAAPKKKRNLNYELGALRSHYKPYVEHLAPDQVVSIPYKQFEPEHLRGSVCAWCSTTWGKNSYTSTLNPTTKSVEIYRFATGQRELF